MGILVKQLAKELLSRGLDVNEVKVVIGCLETRMQFEETLKEVKKHNRLTKPGALAIALSIVDEFS